MKMNLTPASEKVLIIFLSVLCSMNTITPVNGERSLRVIKTKSPLLIHLRDGYGRQPQSHNFQEKNNKKFERWNRKSGPKNYANEFRNWTPNRFPNGKYNPRVDNGKYNPRVDNGKRGAHRPWNGFYSTFREPFQKSKNQGGKARPNGMSHLQKPKPPRLLNDEYYFPEEALKLDSQNDFEVDYPRPKKKRRNPNGVEKLHRRPEFKDPYFESEKLKRPSKQKTRNPYGELVRWPAVEDEYESEGEEIVPETLRQTNKIKRKKIKKKSHSKKKITDPEFVFSYQYDQEDMTDDGDRFEKRSKKRIKKQPYESKDVEDKDYPVIKGLSAAEDPYARPYTKSQNQKPQIPQATSLFTPSHQLSWSQIVSTTERPSIPNPITNPVIYQAQQFSPIQYNEPIQNLQNQYNVQSFAQKPQIITASSPQLSNPYSRPDNYYNKNVIFPGGGISNNQVNNRPIIDQSQVNGIHNRYSNGVYSYQSSGNSFNDNNQNYYSQYTTSNQNYNSQYGGNNHHAQFQSSGTVKNQNFSHLESNQAYGNRINSHQTGKSDAEEDFFRKHQSLYHKGLSGVPIQGDGYRKDSGNGDYDIGYGDFQFDETTST